MLYGSQFGSRPEHIFVGPRRCGKTTLVETLRASGYWAHEHTVETGDEIARIYSAQKKLYEASRLKANQPRIFFSDSAWWQYRKRFNFVNPHLKAEIAFPEAVLEAVLPGRPIDWIYRYGGDARDRLIPELPVAISKAEQSGEPISQVARRESAAFLERVYPELVPPLVWSIPHVSTAGCIMRTIRMPRANFEARMRSYRVKFSFPYDLTTSTITEFLVALGIMEYTNQYYVRFAPIFSVGLAELKNGLTNEAIKARLKKERTSTL
jgi:hypothetical protein